MSVSRPGPRTTATVLAVASALVLSGCGGGDPSPEQRFADALSSGDVQAAADLTSDPAAASTAITAMLDGLNAQGRSFSVSENGDAFTLAADWSFRQRQAVAVLHRGPRGRRRDRVGSRGARARTRRRLHGPVHPHVGDARRGARE
ncbi:hypothetical protein GS416_06645 [Rhodococcus hoagii]|nr:hypothetical protein [Prescottella equi]